jgi:hypothetical protein
MCQVLGADGPLSRSALVDALRLYATTKRSCAIWICSEDDDVGKIHMRDGAIVHASVNDLEELPVLKALFRVLWWTRGTMDTEGEDAYPLPRETTRLAVPDVLRDLLPQITRLDLVRDDLPPLDSALVVTRLREPELTPDERALLDLAETKPCLEAILNASPLMDLPTVCSILDLIGRGYLHAVRAE